jgi:RHS repeat-associated protein
MHNKNNDRGGLTWLRIGALLVVIATGWLYWADNVALACDGGCFPTSGGGSPPAPPAPDPCDDPSTCCKGGGGPGSGSGGGAGGGYGKPVSPYSGKEFYTYTDLTVPGVFDIHMVRKYDNQARYDSPLGYGWAFTYDKRLYKYSDGSVVVRSDCGVRNKYLFTGGAYQADVGRRSTLVEQEDGTFTVTRPSGTEEHYDVEGKLVALEDARGNRLEMSYDARGRLPITGASPFSLDPGTATVVAYDYRLTRVAERTADGGLSGRHVDLHYNEATGRVIDITASDGRVVSYVHDQTGTASHGNLLQVNGLEGLESRFEYQDPLDAHNATSFQIGAGTTPYLNTYDGQDRVIQQTHGQDVYDFVYNPPGIETHVTHTVKDGGGTVLSSLQIHYVLNEYGYPDETRWTLGDGTLYRQVQTRNASQWVTREAIYATPAGGTEALVRAIDYDYDAAGNKTLETVTLASGEVVTKTWDHDHNRVAWTQTVSSLAPTRLFRTEYTYYYDSDGRPTNVHEEKRRKDDGSFQVTTYTYDTQGRVMTTTLPDGHVIHNEYTGAFLTKVYHDNGSGGESAYLKEQYGYDARGNRNSIADANGNTTTLVYDDRGRVIQVTNAKSEETHYTYTGDHLTQIEVGRTLAEGAGQITRLTYTPEGWLETLQKQQDGGAWLTVLTQEYASDGKVIARRDARTRVTRLVYDGLGRVTQVTDPKLKVTRFGYDALGNRIQSNDPKQQETLYTYDALSRLIQTEQKAITPSAITRFTYDAAGNLLTVTDAKDQTTTYSYDTLSNNTAVSQPLGQTVQYVYDDRNRVDYTLNARNQKIDYLYNNWGTIRYIQYYPTAADGTLERTVAFTYTFTGQPQLIQDSAQSGFAYYHTYDVLNRLEQQFTVFATGDPTKWMTYEYDRYGNQNALTLSQYSNTAGTYEQLYHYTYDYNKLNRLTEAKLISPTPFTFDYWDSDELQRITHPNGVVTEYLYEDNGPVRQIKVTGASGVLQQLDYTYDDNANVDTLTSLVGVHDYSYDGLDRLTQALHPAATGLPPSEDFAYDPVGNRESPTDPAAYDYDSNNRIAASPSKTYSFDDDGNQLSRGDGASFSYNSENHLIQYQQGTDAISYAYDPFGRRIRKTVNGVTTYYLWAGANLLMEYDAASTQLRRYAYLPAGYAASEMEDGNGIYTLHADHLDTPKRVTDAAQAVVWKAEHEAYGAVVVNEDPDGDGVQVTLNQRFPGQYYDEETGLHYNWFRYYDPQLGRYIASDPIGLILGNGPSHNIFSSNAEFYSQMSLQAVLQLGINHPYVYVKNNPLAGIDPTGEIGPLGVGLIIIAGFTAYKFYVFEKCVEKCPVDCEGEGKTAPNLQCKSDCFFDTFGAKAKKGPRTKP